jgi:DNA-binding transcriptional ArsR family regulator
MNKGKRTQKITVNLATPTVGMDAIHSAVRALYAYKRPATYKDLATAVNMSETYLSSALSAARDAGLATLAGKRGLYKLTPEGEDYARLLSYGKDSECREILKRLILESPLWSEIVTFLKVSGEQERNASDLVLDIERKLGKKWSQRMRDRVANAYSSILEHAGLVQVSKDRIISQIVVEEGEAELPSKFEIKEKERTREGAVVSVFPTGSKPPDFMDISFGPIFLRIPAELAGQIIPIVTEWMQKTKTNQKISGPVA